MNKLLATILAGGMIVGGIISNASIPTEKVGKKLYTKEQYKALKHDIILGVEAKMLSGRDMTYDEALELIEIYNIENKKKKYNLAGSGKISDKIIRAMAFRERNEK